MNHRTSKNATIQRLVECLEYAGEKGMTSWTLSSQLATVCVATVVAEARRCGYDITCEFEGLSDSGRKIYRYRLRGGNDGNGWKRAEDTVSQSKAAV